LRSPAFLPTSVSADAVTAAAPGRHRAWLQRAWLPRAWLPRAWLPRRCLPTYLAAEGGDRQRRSLPIAVNDDAGDC
jgi:hypothetical protein